MPFESRDRTLDVRGHICPYPLIEIKQALKKLTQGQVLEVLTDYEPAVTMTVPAFCRKAGYPFEIVEAAKRVWRVLIQKSK